jgi:hypothetical protein
VGAAVGKALQLPLPSSIPFISDAVDTATGTAGMMHSELSELYSAVGSELGWETSADDAAAAGGGAAAAAVAAAGEAEQDAAYQAVKAALDKQRAAKDKTDWRQEHGLQLCTMKQQQLWCCKTCAARLRDGDGPGGDGSGGGGVQAARNTRTAAGGGVQAARYTRTAAGAGGDGGGGMAPAPTLGASGAGAETGREWTAEEVAQAVCGLGKAFEQYRDTIIDNDLDGETLLDAADDELKELGISSIHIRKIRKKLAGLLSTSRSSPGL